MAEQSRVTGAIGSGLSGAAAGSAFGPVGTVIGGALGVITGALAGGGEDDAVRLAEEQSKLIEFEGEQNLRRMEYAKKAAVGMSKGLVAASNLQYEYSPVSYVNKLESTYVSDMAFERGAMVQRMKMARLGGEAAASTIKAAGINTLLQGATAAVGTFGSSLFTPAADTGTPSWLKNAQKPGGDEFNIGWSGM